MGFYSKGATHTKSNFSQFFTLGCNVVPFLLQDGSEIEISEAMSILKASVLRKR
jgi:hypothetical protein